MKKLLLTMAIILGITTLSCVNKQDQERVRVFALEIIAIEISAQSLSQDLRLLFLSDPTPADLDLAYAELIAKLNILKQRVNEIQPPPIPEARAVYNTYVQIWARLGDVFTALKNEDTQQAETLYKQVGDLGNQFAQQFDAMLKKYRIARSELGLPG